MGGVSEGSCGDGGGAEGGGEGGLPRWQGRDAAGGNVRGGKIQRDGEW